MAALGGEAEKLQEQQANTPTTGAPTEAEEAGVGDEEGGSTDEEPAKPAPKVAKKRADDGKFTLDKKTVNKWILDNPKEAARLFPDSDVKAKNEFISLAKKRQKLEQRAEEAEAVEARIQALGQEQQKAIDEAIGKAQPGIDILSAIEKNDFVALDLAFQRAGVTYDEWTKKRLRFGATKVTQSAEQAYIKELEAKAKAKAEGKEETKPSEETKADTTEPTYTTKVIAAQVDEDHAVRTVANWEKRIQDITTADEDTSIEEAAEQVLAEARKKLGLSDEDTAAPKGKGKSKRRLADDDGTDDPFADLAIDDYESRKARLLKEFDL